MTKQLPADFQAALNDFMSHIRKMYDDHQIQMGYKTGSQFIYEVSSKFVKVITEGPGTGRSVYCFIAMSDFHNKGLGMVTTGQIFKPAGWAAPTKHARGNIFIKDSYGCAGPYGIVYLRG